MQKKMTDHPGEKWAKDINRKGNSPKYEKPLDLTIEEMLNKHTY